MKVMSHQIDILPYPGFWNRVNQSDIADLGGLYDWFNKGSDYYHHRVKIGTDDNWKWLTLPIEHHTGYRQVDVKLKNDLLPRCYHQLEVVYQDYPNWDKYKDYLHEVFCECKYTYMWELNFKLLVWMRDLLGISTPLCIPKDIGTDGDATSKIVKQLTQYKADTYYCGAGGKHYLDMDQLRSSGITVEWATFKLPIDNYSTVSTLSLIMAFDISEVRRWFNVN